MDPDRLTPRRPLRILVGAVLVAALGLPAVADAQNFNPKTGGDLINDTTVIVSPGERVESDTRDFGSIGVVQCRNLIDDDDAQITFQYELNPNYRGRVELDDQFLLEFPADDGLQGQCDRTSDNACRRLNDGNEDIRISSSQSAIEIEMPFELMLEYRDGLREICAFESSSSGGSRDAGMTDAGTQPVAGGNRIYSGRAFLIGRRNSVGVDDDERLADAAFELDRTRPPAPSDLRAGALSSKIQVTFTPPQQTSNVEGYHVFYSNSQFSSSAKPENLDDREDVERRPLTDATEEDGEISGTISGLSLQAGDTIYVGVASREESKNFSNLARTDGTTQVRTAPDFPKRYSNAGGSETGGCGCSSTTSPRTVGLALLAGLVALLGFRVRRRLDT